MRTIKLIIFYWFPAIGWMTVIFLLSSRQRVSIAGEYVVGFLIFKTLHVLEYAILYFLYLRLFLKRSGLSKPTSHHYLTAIVLALTYATTDELHQTFVPTRQGALRDVFIDAIGISTAAFILKNYFKILKKMTII